MGNSGTEKKHIARQKDNKYNKYFVGGLPPIYPGVLSQGSKGDSVKLLQEFLSLAGFELIIDGDFGPATEGALSVYSFERMGPQYRTPVLTKRAWKSVTNNYRSVLWRVAPHNICRVTLIEYARAHLKAGARELRGMNVGPFVRLYMKGNEGPSFPWCAGFVSFIIKQTVLTYGFDPKNVDIPDTFSCDILARWGEQRGKLITMVDKNMSIYPGAIFLVYKGGHDWVHAGFVMSFKNGCLETIEGNTNIKGSREGVCVMRRFRGINNIHIIYNYLPTIEKSVRSLRRVHNVEI